MKLLLQKFGEKHFEESLLFVSVGIICALVCSFYAKLFALCEMWAVQFYQTHPYYLFGLAPLAFVFSFFLVRWFAPGSSGSGIPQVMACVEISHRHLTSLFLRKSVIVIKIASSLVAIIGGAAIGREGPSLQISAALAHNMGKIFHRFKVNVRTDQLIIAGAASGLAAAFNTPIGGIVYAIEELSKEHVRTFKDVLLLSVVISGLTAQLIAGNYLYLGYPTVPSEYLFSTLASLSLLSFVTGFLGCLFSRFLTLLIIWRGKQSITLQLSLLVMVGLILATLFTFIGPRALFSGKESINYVLFSGGEVTTWEMLSRFFAPLLSSMTGIAGGIFAPSLSTGAVIGGLASHFADPSLRTIFALSGMVGFLTGVTHTPITSFILVLEMTDRHSAVLPMMVAAIMSSIGAHFISQKSFYEESLDMIKANHPSRDSKS